MVRLAAGAVTQGHRDERERNERQDQRQRSQDVSRPQLQLSKLKEIHFKDYAIRFVFGGVISVLAALIGHWVNPRFGGVFTAFPAILLASLTLIGKEDGNDQAAQDAQGARVGAAAFVVIAVFIALTVTRISGAASLTLALAIWTALAVGLYLLFVRVGLLRTFANETEQGEQGGEQGGERAAKQGQREVEGEEATDAGAMTPT